MLAVRADADGSWGPPEVVAERETANCGEAGRSGLYAPHVGVDDAGNTTAIWIEWDCATQGNVVWTSRASS